MIHSSNLHFFAKNKQVTVLHTSRNLCIENIHVRPTLMLVPSLAEGDLGEKDSILEVPKRNPGVDV